MDIEMLDQASYGLAKDHLLGFAELGITEKLLGHYLNPGRPEARHGSFGVVFERLVASGQNSRMKASVIGGSIGGISNLSKVLFRFNPHRVSREYGEDWSALLDEIKKQLAPSGKIRLSSLSLWPKFCRCVLSGAQFLVQFETVDEFCQWVEVFDKDDRTRGALPMLLATEVEGFGFSLACDFLKEIGFLDFCKPDVHIKKITKGLGLVPARAGDYGVFKGITRIARNNGVTPYNVDKLFWLVGSGFFYDHPELGSKGRIRTDRDGFIQRTRRELTRLSRLSEGRR